MRTKKIDEISIIKNAKLYDNIQTAKDFLEGKGGTSHREIRYRKEFEISQNFIQQSNFPKNGKALDIGCSGGRYIQLLLKNGFTSYGVDTSKIALMYANSLFGQNAEFIGASATNLPFKENTFDIVLCIELLHHFDEYNMEQIIEGISSLIKPGGFFICEIRNSLNPILWYSYKKKDGRFFTLKARSIFKMIEILRKYGFSICRKEGIFFPFSIFAPYVAFLCRRNEKRHINNIPAYIHVEDK